MVDALQCLFDVLDGHGVEIDEARFKQAFAASESRESAAAWVDEYLNTETLLSKEEADL